MTYMLTYDHRLRERGGIVTRFINSLTGLLKNPQALEANWDQLLQRGKRSW